MKVFNEQFQRQKFKLHMESINYPKAFLKQDINGKFHPTGEAAFQVYKIGQGNMPEILRELIGISTRLLAFSLDALEKKDKELLAQANVVITRAMHE